MHRSRVRAAALALAVSVAGLRTAEAQATVSSGDAGRAPVVVTSDRLAVRRAVMDYLEGFYEGDTAKLVRSVRADVFKYGFWRGRDSTAFHGERMPWAEFLAYAKQVRARGRQTPSSAPRDVVLFDVQDHTASAKLTASWGTDYLLLGKYDGRWMISSVLWQSPPASAASAASAPAR